MPQHINVASIEPVQSFLSLYIDYYIIEEEGYQRRKWMRKHDDAFASIFEARTGIHIPTLHEMRRDALNPNIGAGTSNLNVQAVFISSLV